MQATGGMIDFCRGIIDSNEDDDDDDSEQDNNDDEEGDNSK